jgi:hypothetical protein
MHSSWLCACICSCTWCVLCLQGPRLGDSSDEDSAGGSRDSSKRRSSIRPNSGNSNGKQQGGEDAAAARWFAPLADGGVPGDLRPLVKVDTPDKQSASACYQLRWPGGWKLQSGTITKFPCVTKPPVLLVRRGINTGRGNSGDGRRHRPTLLLRAKY